MKFDLFKWQEVELGTEFLPPAGRVHIRASEPVAVYAQALGVEAIAGTGTEVIFDSAEALTIRLESASKKVRAFIYSPADRSIERSERRFTSLDRAQSESGTLAEVRRSLRLHKLEQLELRNKFRRELQAEQSKLEALRNEFAQEPDEPDLAEPASPGDDQEPTPEE